MRNSDSLIVDNHSEHFRLSTACQPPGRRFEPCLSSRLSNPLEGAKSSARLPSPEVDRLYDALSESRGGKVIGTDIARNLHPGYASGREGKIRHTQCPLCTAAAGFDGQGSRRASAG